MNISEEDFSFYKGFLDKNSGYNLCAEKSYLLENRLNEVLKCHCLAAISDITVSLQKEPFGHIAQDVIEAMTVNETFFFRDQLPFEYFRKELIPHMADIGKKRVVKMWSAACSTGQEPYTIAMLMHEYKRVFPLLKYELTATDINNRILARARRGVYTNLEVNRGLTEYYLNKYFTKDGTSWQISDELKTNMYFRPHNLKEKNKTTDKYDFVLLRNVLIYFDRDTKVQVLENIKHSMQPGGYLLLGAAEHVPEEITGFRQCSEVRGLYHLGGS